MKQLLAAVLLAGVALSCNPVKQSAKKDARALDRVLGSRKLIDSVKPAVMELYPCANDTVAIQLPGGFDTLYYPIPELDTAALETAIDSVLAQVNTECRESVDRAYRKGYDKALADVGAQQIAIKRPDTIINNILDLQRVKALESEVNNLRYQAANLAGQTIAKDKQIQQADKRADKWLWWFLAAMALTIATNLGWAYTKIRLPK